MKMFYCVVTCVEGVWAGIHSRADKNIQLKQIQFKELQREWNRNGK